MQKLEEAQDISEAVLDAEVKIGELMAKLPKQNTHNRAKNRLDSGVASKTQIIENAGKMVMDSGVHNQTITQLSNSGVTMCEK